MENKSTANSELQLSVISSVPTQGALGAHASPVRKMRKFFLRNFSIIYAYICCQ